MSSDNWVRIPVAAGFVDFLCGANIVGNIISAEKRCNYPGRSRVTRLVDYKIIQKETLKINHSCGNSEQSKHVMKIGSTGLEICGILVANATMFSHLLPGFSCGSKHLLLP